MREASSGMLSVRWKKTLMKPWGIFWRYYGATSSWEHLCGRPSPSACGVQLHAFLSPSLSLWGSYVKKILKTILTDYTGISQYPQYIMLNKNNLNKISYHWEGIKMLSLTNEMVKNINCLTFSKSKRFLPFARMTILRMRWIQKWSL